MGLAEFNLAFQQDSTLNPRLWVGNEIGVPITVLNVTPPGPAGEGYIFALQYWARLGFLNTPESQAIASGMTDPVMATAECDRLISGSTASMNGAGVNTMVMEPGADLRDQAFNVAFDPEIGNGAPVIEGQAIQIMRLSELIRRFGQIAILAPVIRLLQTFGRNARIRWNELPAWARTVLVSVGVVAGTEFIIDDPVGIIPFLGDDTIGGFPSGFHGHPGLGQVSVVGSWVANGVTFYRLSDGKLAVQNKRGRWKVWKPKKPIVLYAGGAVNLKTMLRADRVLDAQAKKIAKMLNRRAPRARKAPASSGKVVMVAQDGSKIIDI